MPCTKTCKTYATKWFLYKNGPIETYVFLRNNGQCCLIFLKQKLSFLHWYPRSRVFHNKLNLAINEQALSRTKPDVTNFAAFLPKSKAPAGANSRSESKSRCQALVQSKLFTCLSLKASVWTSKSGGHSMFTWMLSSRGRNILPIIVEVCPRSFNHKLFGDSRKFVGVSCMALVSAIAVLTKLYAQP